MTVYEYLETVMWTWYPRVFIPAIITRGKNAEICETFLQTTSACLRMFSIPAYLFEMRNNVTSSFTIASVNKLGKNNLHKQTFFPHWYHYDVIMHSKLKVLALCENAAKTYKNSRHSLNVTFFRLVRFQLLTQFLLFSTLTLSQESFLRSAK